ncbi:MAG: agmatine deiminase family protein, partial [Vicinamibacterales bacterium]
MSTRPHPPAPGRTPRTLGYTFPPEWARHRGTWISWPRPEGISFPDRYHESIEDVVRVIAAIARFEEVHLNVPNSNYRRIVRDVLDVRGV